MMDDMKMSPESAAPASEDLSQGFEICIYVSPTGFRVEGPLPMEPEPQTESPEMEDETDVPDVATALKHVLAIIKENPLGNDAESQMQAGYEAKNQ
jgi:hypothetical protein